MAMLCFIFSPGNMFHNFSAYMTNLHEYWCSYRHHINAHHLRFKTDVDEIDDRSDDNIYLHALFELKGALKNPEAFQYILLHIVIIYFKYSNTLMVT